MKVISLHLKNFKIHKDKNIEFSEKNLIIGENGTGKSSIFHAILFGLFGSESKEYLNVSKVSSLIRDLSSEAKVVLKLKSEENIITIERTIRKEGSTYSILKVNDDIVATTPLLVKKKIFEILNINRENKILDVLYIPQGELGKYVKLSGKKELTELTEKLFDLDYYSVMLEVVKRVLRDLLIEKERISTQIYQKERDIQKFRKVYGDKSIEELEKLAREYESIQKEYLRLQSLYTKISSLLQTIDYNLISKKQNIISKLQQIDKEILEIEEKVSKIKTELKSLEYSDIDRSLLDIDIRDLESMLEEIEQQIRNIDKYSVQKEIEELEILQSYINQYISLRSIEEEYLNTEEKISSLRAEYTFLESKIQELNNILKVIRDKRFSKCPICGKLLNDEEQNKIRVEKERELEQLLKKKREIYFNLQELNKKYATLRFKYNKLNALKRILEDKGLSIDNLDNEKEKIIKNLTELKEKLKSIERYELLKSTINYLKSRDLSNSLRELELLLDNLKRERLDLHRTLEKIELMENNLKKINELLYTNNFTNLEELKKYISELDNRLKSYVAISLRELELYKMHLSEIDELKRKQQNIKTNISTLNSLKTVLERFIMSYRKTVAKRLSAAFNYYFKKLYIYHDIKEVKLELKYERQEWKFHFYVKKNIDNKEIWRDIREANLSGGQVKIMDLAFRLALAYVLRPNLKVLLLDEPTESLDENVRYSLAELLDSLKEYQIILCTHDELFKEKIQGKVFEFSRKGR